MAGWLAHKMLRKQLKISGNVNIKKKWSAKTGRPTSANIYKIASLDFNYLTQVKNTWNPGRVLWAWGVYFGQKHDAENGFA